MSPSRVLSRYAPLAAVLAVQTVLVLAVPNATTTTTTNGGNAANGGNQAAGVTGNGVTGVPGSVSGGVSGGSTGGSTVNGGTTGGSTGSGPTGPIVNTSTDRSRCAKN